MALRPISRCLDLINRPLVGRQLDEKGRNLCASTVFDDDLGIFAIFCTAFSGVGKSSVDFECKVFIESRGRVDLKYQKSSK